MIRACRYHHPRPGLLDAGKRGVELPAAVTGGVAEDIAGDAWAGVVPLVASHAAPLPAPDLRPGIDVPPSVRGLGSDRRGIVHDRFEGAHHRLDQVGVDPDLELGAAPREVGERVAIAGHDVDAGLWLKLESFSVLQVLVQWPTVRSVAGAVRLERWQQVPEVRTVARTFLPALVSRGAAQISAFAPDVVYCQDLWFFTKPELDSLRPPPPCPWPWSPRLSARPMPPCPT